MGSSERRGYRARAISESQTSFRCERVRISAEGGVELRRGFRDREEASAFDEREGAGGYDGSDKGR